MQVNPPFPFIQSFPLLCALQRLVREKSREDMGDWKPKVMVRMGCRDVTSLQTCIPCVKMYFDELTTAYCSLWENVA